MRYSQMIVPAGYVWLQYAHQLLAMKKVEFYISRSSSGSIHSAMEEAIGLGALVSVRRSLLGGQLIGMYCGERRLEEIHQTFWRKDEAEEVVRAGYVQVEGCEYEECVFVKADDLDLLLQSEDNYASDAKAPDRIDKMIGARNDYISPFVSLMLGATLKFDIPNSFPKKDTLIRYFLDQSLPDGTPISKNQAEYMATFCRPAEMMRGGNKRIGS